MGKYEQRQKDRNLKFKMTWKEACEKCAERHSCMRKVVICRSMSASPAHLSEDGCVDVRKLVNHTFTPLLFHFNEALKGVPVAYGNIKCLDRVAKLVDDWPRVVLRVQIEVVVFAPRVKQKLHAVVNKISPCRQHLGLLACNLFNVSVYKSKLSKGKRKDGEDVKVKLDGDGGVRVGDQVNCGDRVKVEVVGMSSLRSTLHVKANLIKVLKS